MNSRVLVAGLGRADGPIGEARRRRDNGDEVIYAGGGLDARQIAHIARGEDVRLVVVAGSAAGSSSNVPDATCVVAPTDPLAAVADALANLGIDDIDVVAPVSS